MPPRSTELRMASFDPDVFITDSTSLIYKILDACCGDSGIGLLIKEIFLARAGAALETIYFNDLDYIFSNLHFLARTPSEQYSYDPMRDMLNSNQWDEVRQKDAWYRARVKDFFAACSLGGTPAGIKKCIQAAVSVDCDIYENYRYIDNFGLTSSLGRTSARNEVTIVVHKDSLRPEELRLCRDMLRKIMPLDSIVTINTNGLGVATPVPVSAAASDSEYYEVQKVITPTPVLENVPAPELLAIDLLPTEEWIFSQSPTLAPYAAFNITAESGYYYLMGGGRRSPIDSVTYGTLQADGSVKTEPNYEVYNTTGTYTDWRNYEKADSPDNYPGGKFGLTPGVTPARNPDGTPYHFRYTSQQEYVTSKMAEVIAAGGVADSSHYRYPIQKSASTKRVFYPELAIAYNPPARSTTVTSSGTYRRGRRWSGNWRALNMFARTNQ